MMHTWPQRIGIRGPIPAEGRAMAGSGTSAPGWRPALAGLGTSGRQRPAGGQRWPERRIGHVPRSARPKAGAGRTGHAVPGQRPALGMQCQASRRPALAIAPFPCQTGHAVPGRPKAGMVPWLSPLITVQVDLIILAKFWRLRPVFSHIFEKGARGSKPLPHRCVAHLRGVRSAARTLPPPALRSPPPPPPQPATSRKPFHTLTPPPLPLP